MAHLSIQKPIKQCHAEALELAIGFVAEVKAGKRLWMFDNDADAGQFAGLLYRRVQRYFPNDYYVHRDGYEVHLKEGRRPARKYSDIIERAKTENWFKYPVPVGTSIDNECTAISAHFNRYNSALHVTRWRKEIYIHVEKWPRAGSVMFLDMIKRMGIE